MKKSKNNLLLLMVLITTALAHFSAAACCTVCFGQSRNDCYEFEATCSAICCECSCVNSMEMHINPATDYILAISGRPAYVVNGVTKIKIASDNMVAFMTTMNTKYQSAKREDPKIKKEIADAWASFFKKPDNSSVSPKRLAAFTNETGLKIHTYETNKK